RAFVRWEWAVCGAVMAAALHPSTYRFYAFQPDSPGDLLVWTAVAVLTVEERFGWLPWVVMAGAFNRETAVFAVVVHAALGPCTRRGGGEGSRAASSSCGVRSSSRAGSCRPSACAR